MRINVYHHEMKFAEQRVEIVAKRAEGFTYYGLRVYTEAPVIDTGDLDDDSGAVTFWYPTRGDRRLPDTAAMARMLGRMIVENARLDRGDGPKAD